MDIRRRRRVLILPAVFFLLALAGAGALFALRYWNLLPRRSYTAADFGIATVRGRTDRNGNGVDDYTDILRGARAYVQTRPVYKSAYYAGGYPPDGEGVCTDVIWKAFKNAGYSLKDLVDADVAAHRSDYPGIQKPDPNIDFRRVRNLTVFFRRNALPLTTDPNRIAAWQPGDIVIFRSHIAVISDKRNAKGQPYILHNAGQPNLEEDALTRYRIVGHYRWAK